MSPLKRWMKWLKDMVLTDYYCFDSILFNSRVKFNIQVDLNMFILVENQTWLRSLSKIWRQIILKSFHAPLRFDLGPLWLKQPCYQLSYGYSYICCCKLSIFWKREVNRSGQDSLPLHPILSLWELNKWCRWIRGGWGEGSEGGWLNYSFLNRTSSVLKSVHCNVWR
jgi:hypothetical protein